MTSRFAGRIVVVTLALFLASDDARFINCEIVHCDAGNQLRGWRG